MLGILALGFTAVYFYLVSCLTNLGFTTGLIKLCLCFIISCGELRAFISSLTGRIRSSVVTLLAILGAFLAVQFAYGALLGLGEEATISLPLLYLRQTLSYIFQGINWISPFAFLSRGLDAVVLESWSLYLANIVYCLIYSLIFMALSITMNRRS